MILNNKEMRTILKFERRLDPLKSDMTINEMARIVRNGALLLKTGAKLASANNMHGKKMQSKFALYGYSGNSLDTEIYATYLRSLGLDF